MGISPRTVNWLQAVGIEKITDYSFLTSPTFFWSILFSSPFLIALMTRLWYRLLGK
ncbi:hypothetical protein [Calothrix sp. 336/3]